MSISQSYETQEAHDGALRMFLDYADVTERDNVICLFDPSLEGIENFLRGVLAEISAQGIVVEATSDLDILSSYNELTALFLFQRTSSLFSKEIARDKHLWRAYRVFDAVPDLFGECFRIPKCQIEELHTALITVLGNSKELRIKSSGGTDLEIIFNQDFGWLSSYGISDGNVGVMPPSEIATYSAQVNGVMIADGAINANFEFPGDPRLHEYPIMLEFHNSNLVNFQCPDPFLYLSISSFLASPNARCIGEVGFGTNFGLRSFVPFLSHINERYPGLHIGLGSHNQGNRLDWFAPLHLDFIPHKSNIIADGFEVMSNGLYNLEMLKERARTLPKIKVSVVPDTL